MFFASVAEIQDLNMALPCIDVLSPVQKRISRHRARHAVRVAGLPLWRNLVSRAEQMLQDGATVADVALRLRADVTRLPAR